MQNVNFLQMPLVIIRCGSSDSGIDYVQIAKFLESSRLLLLYCSTNQSLLNRLNENANAILLHISHLGFRSNLQDD